jgi:hypothetical protein
MSSLLAVSNLSDATSQLYIDVTALGQPQRLYRLVQVSLAGTSEMNPACCTDGE